MARPSRYFTGFGKGKPETGVWVYRKGQEPVKVSERSRAGGSATLIMGEPVICKVGGETLDFGEEKVRVEDSAAKARELRKRGLMPSPEGRYSPDPYDPQKVPSFAEHFHQETGVPLSEAGPNLIHLKKRS